MKKLLLFDIDGTLVDTGGSGMHSLQQAARDVFGDTGPDLDLAGSTDEGIVRGMISHFGKEPHQQLIDEFYQAYLKQLSVHLRSEAFPGTLLPGVEDLLDSISAQKDTFTVGLLTGNIAEGGWRKVRAYGIDHHFSMGAWGDDHWDRNKLGPIALERAAQHHGVQFSGEDTWIIGDTPKDIACARAFGARVLAVETGRFRADELSDADAVFENLAETTAAEKLLAS